MNTTTDHNYCTICTLNHQTEQHYDAEFAPLRVKRFQPVRLTDTERATVIDLWHLSRVESSSRWLRLAYVEKWFRRRHGNEYSEKALWLALGEETAGSR